MNCMKCSRETPAERVFCDDCLLEMEKYPVRPGTVINLPKRTDIAVKKLPKKKTISSEEQIALLKKKVRRLTYALILALAAAAAMVLPTYEHLMEDHFKIGQNYNTVTSTTAPAQTSTPTEN